MRRNGMIQRSTLCETKANFVGASSGARRSRPSTWKLPVAIRTRRVNSPATVEAAIVGGARLRIVQNPEPLRAGVHRHHQILDQGVGREGHEAPPPEGVDGAAAGQGDAEAGLHQPDHRLVAPVDAFRLARLRAGPELEGPAHDPHPAIDEVAHELLHRVAGEEGGRVGEHDDLVAAAGHRLVQGGGLASPRRAGRSPAGHRSPRPEECHWSRPWSRRRRR